MDSREKQSRENPVGKSNFLSFLFFGWTAPIFWKGTRRDLNVTDLYDPLESDRSERLGDRLEREWEKELRGADRASTLGKDGSKKPKAEANLGWAIFRMFWAPYMIQGLLLFVKSTVLQLMLPVLQRLIISYFNPGRDLMTQNQVLLYTGLLVIVTFAGILITHHTTLRNRQIGMCVRVACCSMIYRKILRLVQAAVNKTSDGQVANLISNDVARFDKVPLDLHYIWITPIQVSLIGYMMWQSVGSATLVGMGAMIVLTVPVQGYLSTLSGIFRSKIAVKTDERVQLMSELIPGIQIVKMYSWEKPFELIVSKVRELEMKYVTYASYLRGFDYSIVMFAQQVCVFCTLTSFVLMGNRLTAEIAYLIVALFVALHDTCTIHLPEAIITAGEAAVSLKRVKEFLLLDEVQCSSKAGTGADNGQEEPETDQRIDRRVGVEIVNVTANWVRHQIPSTLRNVTMEIKSQSLCALVGPVGSGKSSLLHLLLGELPAETGRLSLFTGENKETRITSHDIRISYASQDPWLFSATIRDNILFGQPYDRTRYQEVTRVCALHKDFEQLPQGDLSFVGERGACLSGGQRARVNLARAVYREAELYLLDDPLSAVDAQVGRNLFEECINGFLGGKTRILVTHQPQYLRKAGTVVVLNRGSVECQGTYDELVEANVLMMDAEESREPDEVEYRNENNGSNLNRKTISVTAADKDAGRSKLSENDENSKDIGEEENATGDISNKVYWDYFSAGGNLCSLAFLAAIFLTGQVVNSGADSWLSYWIDEETLRVTSQSNKSSAGGVSYSTDPGGDPRQIHITEWQWSDEDGLLRQDIGIYIYTACVLGSVFFITLRSLLFTKMCMNASRNIHNFMFANFFRTPMRFFNTNPSGRILNRFSKDVGTMDELLPRVMLETFQIFTIMIGLFVLIGIANNWMILPTLVVCGIFYIIRRYYLMTAQDVKRLEGITKSPMFSHANSTLNGLTTIRSRGVIVEELLRKEFDNHQDAHTGAWYLSIATATAFGFFLDLISCAFVACVCFSFILMDDGDTLGGIAGMAISQSQFLIGTAQYGIRQSTELVSQLTAVERVLQYTNLPKEGPFTTSRPPPSSWPSKGGLVIKNVTMRYAENKPPVLKSLNLIINPGWKVGIVGRTGAGKSSLVSALFRLTGDGLEGEIVLDGIDTKSVGLHELRPRISIIPQQPVLFSASLRHNLDPFEKYSDAKLWDSLREVELGDVVPSLDFRVHAGGANFSVGQRQLVCLARAILRNSRLLVLDEATANVDRRTDALIQNTIRRRFADCTVLTIAHRVNTIMDSDRVLVMADGQIVEFGHPHLLLENRDGHFSQMLQQTGKTTAAKLARIAENAFLLSPDFTFLEKKHLQKRIWYNTAYEIVNNYRRIEVSRDSDHNLIRQPFLPIEKPRRLQSQRQPGLEESPRWRAEFFAPVFRETFQTLPEVMEIHLQNKQTRILATMVPDELVHTVDPTKKEVKTLVGIVLLADVSGMTLLHDASKYAGHGGSIGLNTTLKTYFGYMVQAVYSYGGDVLKITENGLLAIWNVRDDELIFNTIHEVITCGLRIQQAIGRFVTKFNVTLKLKLAVSAGNLTFMVIGGNNCYHYLIAGPPMEEAKLAKDACLPGDLVLAGSAWCHCNPSCYEYVLKDTYNVKVQKIITIGRHAMRRNVVVDENSSKEVLNVDERVTVYGERIDPQDEFIVASRPAIKEAVSRQLGKKLKTFIFQSAVRLIDSEQPLEYLTESSRVTLMFINMIPSKCSAHDLIKLVDDVFILLTNSLLDRGGHVIRVSLFQKDVSLLTVFGLPNGSNESDCRNALVNSLKLRSSIKNLYGVEKVSVVVTTGIAHCGIVGHSLRQEYIVIGSPFQRAIKITCVDKVTCDVSTLLRSNLPWNRFVQITNKVLRKVGSSSIYEYIDDKSNGSPKNVKLLLGYPILGRSAELNIMNMTLDDIGLEDRDHAGILLEGESGSGKSRLLDAFISLIKAREISAIRITLTPDYSIAPYSLIYPILSEMLDIDEYCSIEVREQKMVKRFEDVVSPQDFCYLNEILRVRFPISKQCSMKNELERQTQATKILKKIFLMSKIRRCIVIDDMHNIDQMSWQILSLTLDVKYMLLLASIKVPFDDPVPKSVSEIFSDKRMIHLNVGPVNSQTITALACQILSVQAIPQFLERDLLSKTKNNPRHCQALLTAALCHGGLQRVEMTPKKAKEYMLMFSPVHMLTKIPLNAFPEDLAPPLPWERRLKIHACLISNHHQLMYSCRSSKTRDTMLETYINLSTYEQGLLKCAAILGVIFTRHMLQSMMSNFSNFHTTRAITNMFNLRILCCASVIIPSVVHTESFEFCMSRKRSTFSDSRHLLYCDCLDPRIGDAYTGRESGATLADELPWYSRCKFLAFEIPRFQQLVYDLIPNDEKRQFHHKAIDLYEVEAHKCKACGGGNFFDFPTRLKTNNRAVQSTNPPNATPFVDQRKRQSTMKRESAGPATRRISSEIKSNQTFPTSKPTSGATISYYQAHGEPPKPMMDSTESDTRRRVSILPFYTEQNNQTITSSESSLETPGDMKEDRVVKRSGKFCDWMKNPFSNKSAVGPVRNGNSRALRVPRLTRFRGVDFRNCQCSMILDNVFKRLLYHSKNSGNIGSHIQYLINYSAGLIRIAEYLHAIKILTRADELNKNYERFVDDAEESIISRLLTKGIIFSLVGETYFQLGYYDKARRFTLDEMAIYGCMLSTKKMPAYHQLFTNEGRQLVYPWFPSRGKDALEQSRISTCISRLSSIFLTKDQPSLAKLTILMSLNMSSKYNDQPITTLCSYRLAMLYYRQIGDMGSCKRLEKSALKIIADQFTWNDLHGVLVVADVYESIFYSKLIRGELQKAIEYGLKAIQIAAKFHLVKFKLEMLPILIQAMVQAKRIPEAVDLLRELAYLAQEDVDMSATIWYYALCLELLLDAGVSVESLGACQEFARKLIESNGKKSQPITRDPDCSNRLITNMCLLLTRMGIDSPKYELARDVYVAGMRHDNYSSLSTILKAIECRMLKITYFLNYKKGNTIPDIRGDIVELVSGLTKASKTSIFLKPRLYLLKGYMSVILGQTNSAKRMIGAAQKSARRQENLLMQASIELHRTAWLENYPMSSSHWSEVAGQEKKGNWHDAHNLSNDDYIATLYCLPKPENCL